MLQKILWNDIARSGVLIGLVMSAFRVLDITILISRSSSFALLTSVIGITGFVIYIILVRYAVLKFVAKLPKGFGFSYMQSLSFISLTSMLASVWVAITSTVMITQVVGFERYIEIYVETIRSILDANAAANPLTIEMGEATLAAVESSTKPDIVDSLFGTAFTYIVRALIVGVPLSFWLRRKADKVDNSKVEDNE